jgi:hypothetical protein
MRKRSCWTTSLLPALVLAMLIKSPVTAGEIPGMPAPLLPLFERDFSLTLSNDFLGEGGIVDDFRTQQVIATLKLNQKWLAVVDHSILTFKDPSSPGRLDQVSASLGYQLIDNVAVHGTDQLTIGGGLRSTGDYAGEKIQNGFHRLVGSDIESMPYVDTDSVDLTAWFEAQRYRELGEYKKWSTGYWLRAGSLLTSDGQFDSVVSATAVASKGLLSMWFGLRRDWRGGYDADFVQVGTAQVEDDGAIVFGLRFGALVLETTRQLNNNASYGQLSLVSSGYRGEDIGFAEPRGSVAVGLLFPDVEVQLVGKLRSNIFIKDDSAWNQSLFVDLRYGEPQYGSDESQYLHTQQIGVGVEWERRLSQKTQWVSFYGSLGAGWREEQLEEENGFGNSTSDNIGRTVIIAGAGLRLNTASLGRSWSYRLDLGLTAWVPLEDARVELDGAQYLLQKPSLALILGMTFDYSPGL